MNNELPVSLLYISSADENNELVDKLQKDNVQYLQLSNSVEAIQFLQIPDPPVLKRQAKQGRYLLLHNLSS